MVFGVMNILLLLVGCGILWVLCWPLLLVIAVLLPIVWLLSIPFRILGIVVEAMLALLRAILFFPARLLGGRRVPSRG
jgi:hypothetical protein